MNKKEILFKALKTVFFLAGFPLMIMLMIITLAPMFDAEVMGSHAQNWVIVFTVIWVILLIIHFLLDKFIGEKSATHHKCVLVVMSVLSILLIVLPTACYDAVNKPKYEEAKAQLVGNVAVKDYNAVQGWHRDFTTRYKSDVYVLINENYDFCKMYGLKGVESAWYVHADKENELGYKYGSFEKAEVLVKEKLAAKAKLETAQAELATIEAEIQSKLDAMNSANTALEADPANTELQAKATEASNAYAQILADKDEDLVRLKGQRVDITDYKDQLVDLVITVVKDHDNVLPDGLNINLIGIDISVNGILNNAMIKAIIDGVLKPDMLKGLIPDVIYTGIGPETVSTLQKAVDGSDSDVSLAQAQKLNFMYEYYPATLASGAVKYVSYICLGLVVFGIFAIDYCNKKLKEIAKQKEEGANND